MTHTRKYERGHAGALPALIAGLILVGAGVASCGINSAMDKETMTAGLSSPTTSALQPLGAANSSPKTQRPAEPGQRVIEDVRIGTHDGFDRVVFEFSGYGDIGWFVDYTTAPTQQGSNTQIGYRGSTALNVNIDGVSKRSSVGLADRSFAIDEGTSGNIVEVIDVGTADSRAQFVIGLNAAVPYSVQVLEHPTRLVIDLVQTS
ncbi:AMIN-like domain-containing (lipo)protein [Corynebacterium uterequi]|uniref:AMIN-like domain-containing protein n=1 Tax=Corynebacterium uterequi TaxID=1072256 RepID=A0A0G3HH21_9CORY|nr:hypothetical protein [Corynebacterium uterequi]AKK10457.1 hypothetical protein CUTER_02210 [Corynebacterium uterequi]